MATLIIGASGAIGQELCRALVRRGSPVIACVRATPLPADIAASSGVTVEKEVSVTDKASLHRVVEAHAQNIACVWNLAAPLSVDTAGDPEKVQNTVQPCCSFFACRHVPSPKAAWSLYSAH